MWWGSTSIMEEALWIHRQGQAVLKGFQKRNTYGYKDVHVSNNNHQNKTTYMLISKGVVKYIMVHSCNGAIIINNESPTSTCMGRSACLGHLCVYVHMWVYLKEKGLEGSEPVAHIVCHHTHCMWQLCREWTCGDSRETCPFCFGMLLWFECFTMKMCSRIICVIKRLQSGHLGGPAS